MAGAPGLKCPRSPRPPSVRRHGDVTVLARHTTRSPAGEPRAAPPSPWDGLTGGGRVGVVRGLQLGRYLPERDRVDNLQALPHDLIRAVLTLGPQTECDQELGGQRDQVTACLAVQQLGRPRLDVLPRPRKQLVERAHSASLSRWEPPSPCRVQLVSLVIRGSPPVAHTVAGMTPRCASAWSAPAPPSTAQSSGGTVEADTEALLLPRLIRARAAARPAVVQGRRGHVQLAGPL